MDRSKLQATHQQLIINLQSSEAHFKTLRHSVQQLSASIITQVSQIAKLQGQKVLLTEQFGNLDHEFKSNYQQNIRLEYKLQKMQLKIQESQKKKSIYSQMVRKAQQTNQLFKQRVRRVQVQVQSAKAQAQKMDQQMIHDQVKGRAQFQDAVNLQNSTIQRKGQCLKFQTTQLQILQDKLWKLKRKNRGQQDSIKNIQKEIEELNCKTSRKIRQCQQNKENNCNFNQLENLSQKNKRIDEKILKYLQWIKNSEDNLSAINQVDNQYTGKISKQSLDLLRQIKRSRQHIEMVAKTMVKSKQLQ